MKKEKTKQDIFQSDTQEKIEKLCDNFKEFLLQKNKNYGDSMINPTKIFSIHEPNNSICKRLDEKLQRVINSPKGLIKNDVVDVLGYIMLLMIQKDWLEFDDILE